MHILQGTSLSPFTQPKDLLIAPLRYTSQQSTERHVNHAYYSSFHAWQCQFFKKQKPDVVYINCVRYILWTTKQS